MSKFERFGAASRGVAVAVFKRGVPVVLVLLVIQLLTLQLSVDTSDSRQQQQAQERLQKALAENEAEHQKTQAFVRCLIGIVLLPLADRPEDPQQALNTCGSAPERLSVVDPESRSSDFLARSAPAPESVSTARVEVPTTSAPPEQTVTVPTTPQQRGVAGQLLQPTVQALDSILMGVL